MVRPSRGQLGVADKRYFQGLPSPSGAAIIAAGVWIGADYGIDGSEVSWLVAFVTTFAGLLMVSNFRFHSFKETDLRGRVPFIFAVVVMLGYAVVLLHPPVVLFAGFASYAASGPIITLIQRQRKVNRKRDRRTRQAPAQDEDDPTSGL